MARFEGASLASCAHTYTLRTGVQSHLIFVISFTLTSYLDLNFPPKITTFTLQTGAIYICPSAEGEPQKHTIQYFQTQLNAMRSTIFICRSVHTALTFLFIYMNVQKHAFHACVL